MGGDLQLRSSLAVDSVDEAARRRFGIAALHDWQREAVEAVIGGAHVLVVAPTGGGKSLCYQLPATLLDGTSLVVSPLIALMEDQVRALTQRGIEATFLASTLDPDERRRREHAIFAGRYRLVYVAPERLAASHALERFAQLNPPLVAIDEAHCISQWGHDFRPDYRRLEGVLEVLAPPRVMACTATATPLVRRDIIAGLGLPAERTHTLLRGFARPNLHLEAAELERPRDRRRVGLQRLQEALGDPVRPKGGAIVYAGTRKGTERMAEQVGREGWRTAPYHAGLDAARRAEVSRRFADRELDVVVATNAFGMGIDRPDIRAVVHVHAPGSIEEYYQEVGRAGRDGRPALGVLLTCSYDFGLRRRLIEHGRDGEPADREHVQRQWNLFLDLMRYVEAGSCRHDFVLRYFGDEQETLGGCGHCDVCLRLERGGGGDRRVDEGDALVVRKALSGVARARRRAGLRGVADMLHGRAGAKMRRRGLDQLSTFGLLADRPPEWSMALLRRLITAGLVDLTPDAFPVPCLTPAGTAVMKGEQPVRVLPPEQETRSSGGRQRGAGRTTARKGPRPADAPASSGAPRPEPVDVDPELFEALRAERLAMARDRGVAAFVVCHDRTLREIATQRPTTREELAAVHGMGPARIEASGERLLAVVRRATGRAGP